MYDYEILSDGICTAFTRLDKKKKKKKQRNTFT